MSKIIITPYFCREDKYYKIDKISKEDSKLSNIKVYESSIIKCIRANPIKGTSRVKSTFIGITGIEFVLTIGTLLQLIPKPKNIDYKPKEL